MPPRRRGSARQAARRTAAPTWLAGGATTAPVFRQYLPMVSGPEQTAAPAAPASTYLPVIPRGQGATTAMPRIPAPPVATTPMRPYLPTTLRATPAAGQGGQQQGAGWTPPYEEAFGWWTPEQQEGVTYDTGEGRQYTRPQTPAERAGAAVAAAAAGRGGGAGGLMGAPPGVNPSWYAEFQRQHGGQTPEEFYARTGEGLPEAMADEEWSRGFAEMYGRPPTDDDWRAHWFATRVGYTPEEREAWERRRAAGRARNKNPQEEASNMPPVWQPPQIIWR